MSYALTSPKQDLDYDVQAFMESDHRITPDGHGLPTRPLTTDQR